MGSSEFTLNPKSTEDREKAGRMDKGQVVSEFTVGMRNPTSKKIKDKIMNAKRGQVWEKIDRLIGWLARIMKTELGEGG